MCVLEACPTTNFSPPTFSDHLTIAPFGSASALLQVHFYKLLQCIVFRQRRVQVLHSYHQKVLHTQILNFTQAKFKKDTQHALWRLARETRKCPEVQSFAVNADELGPHGAGGNRLVVEASASRVQCRVQPLLAVQCRAPWKCSVQGSAFPLLAPPLRPRLPSCQPPPLHLLYSG